MEVGTRVRRINEDNYPVAKVGDIGVIVAKVGDIGGIIAESTGSLRSFGTFGTAYPNMVLVSFRGEPASPNLIKNLEVI